MWKRWFPNERYVTKRGMKSKSAENKYTLDVVKKQIYTAVLAAQESPSYKNSLLIFSVNLAGRTASELLERWLER